MDKFKIIDGKKISELELRKVKQEVLKIKAKKKRTPMLSVILVGDDEASKIYVKKKESIAKQVGINVKTYKLPKTASKKTLEKLILKLNNEKATDAILLQLPLPSKLDREYFLSLISPKKDVDCLTTINQAKIYKNIDTNLFPCTPLGVMKLINFAINNKKVVGKLDLSGKEVLIIGRSFLVGKPLSLMLLNKNATITVAHSRTKNLQSLVANKDIIISCVGKENLINSKDVKSGAILIDVGISRSKNKKLVGDFNFQSFKSKKVSITPVPRGVGPMTIAMLMQNTLVCYKNNLRV